MENQLTSLLFALAGAVFVFVGQIPEGIYATLIALYVLIYELTKATTVVRIEEVEDEEGSEGS